MVIGARLDLNQTDNYRDWGNVCPRWMVLIVLVRHNLPMSFENFIR